MGKGETLDQRIEDWLSARAGSPNTRVNWITCWRHFTEFCMARGKDPLRIVDGFRDARYQGERERDRFLDEWNDTIRAFNTWLKSEEYAPFSMKNHLVAVRSFLKFYKIPLDVELPKRIYVLYHNKDFSKEQLRLILSRAHQRERTLYLLLLESGLRATSAITLRYWQIKADFEKDIIPMRIETPAATLKDHVGDRWTFIGSDGFKALQEYLQPRGQLRDDDLVFISERPGKMKGEQFSLASASVMFARTVKKLHFERGAPTGKPGHYRMHGLRKYFRNNMRADPAYREFWMGHSLGTDEHYISRDPEFHRKLYKQNYEGLRVLEPTMPIGMTQEIEQLRAQIQELREQDEFNSKMWEDFLKDLTEKDPEAKGKVLTAVSKQIMKLMSQLGKEDKKEETQTRQQSP